MRSLPGLLTMAAAACALACSSSPSRPTTPEVPGPETSQLVAALRGLGASADVIEVQPESSFFTVPSVRLRVNGGHVWVYEYATVSEADEGARRVPGVLALTLYFSTPHFFRGNRLVVLYVGTETDVLGLLERLLGPQFAGG